MNVGDIQVFSKVAATRSFSVAAEQLGITRSAVSKCISRLESELGVTLLYRSPRSASLTNAGRRFYEHSLKVEEALERAVASVSGADQRPSGNVSVSLPTSLGAALMRPLMTRFRREWPDISLNLHFDDHYIDLVGNSIDVAIRVAQKLDDSNLLSRRISTTREVLVASPLYLERHGTPRTIEDLRQHRCLAAGSAVRRRVTWRFDGSAGQQEVALSCATTSNSVLALILAACMDDGIIYVPEILVGSELAQGLLKPVMPELSANREWGVYAVYPTPRPAAKVHALIEFIEKQLPVLDTLDRWNPLAEEPAAGTRLASVHRR